MQVSQYLCSTCGSILKETAEYIEIHSLREECPSCGSMLAESLQRRPLQPAFRWSPPKIQTADTLLKLRFDIAKIDSFIGLRKTDLCCITGYNANILLTRLCVRSLLSERHGGLNCPYVLVADTGNRSDVYGAINFAMQYGMNKERVAERILVIRAFTIPQVLGLLSIEIPTVIRKYQIKGVIVPGLLNTLDEEPNMKAKEAKKAISKIMKIVNEISRKILVVTSIQNGRYSEWILPDFKKRIDLFTPKDGRLTAELYNQGNRKTISLTEREMLIVPKK
jgi:DNA-directed RNA polymerase subunit RPC12/RpoP